MDYFNLAFIAIIILQSFVFRKILNSKISEDKLESKTESLKDDINKSVSESVNNLEDKLSNLIAERGIDNHIQMKELNIFCHELAKLQREEVLNLHTKINDLQKKLVKSGATLTEMKEDIKLIAKNPNKARKKFSQDEEQ